MSLPRTHLPKDKGHLTHELCPRALTDQRSLAQGALEGQVPPTHRILGMAGWARSSE